MPEPRRPFPISEATADPSSASKNATLPHAGPRKLIRPTIAAHALPGHRSSLLHHGSEALTVRAGRPAAFAEDSHAEAFYFQKQMQAHTPMVVVLETGEHIEGTLEWYDHNAIQLINSQRRRTMIYKASIKYLYKAAEKSQHTIMK